MHTLAYFFLAYAVLALNALCGIALLPALIVSHRFQQAFFASFYQMCQKVWDKSYATARRRVLARLNHLESHDLSLRSRGAVRMLEVGAAYGPNLEFVDCQVEYWKVEPNAAFEPSFQKNLAANPKVEMKCSIRGFGEDMSALPDGHFDAVLLTYVLCSAKDCQKLLSECKRVLVKGGVLLCCEHVGHPKGTWERYLQDVFAPLALNITCGCYMNRDSGDAIKSAGFASVDLQEVFLNIPFMYNHHVYGVATA